MPRARVKNNATLGMATVEDIHFNLQWFVEDELRSIFPRHMRKYIIKSETPSEFKKDKDYSIYDVGIRKIVKIENSNIISEPISSIEICNNDNKEILLARIPKMFSQAKTLKEVLIYNYITDEYSLYTSDGDEYHEKDAYKSTILGYNLKEIIDNYYYFCNYKQ